MGGKTQQRVAGNVKPSSSGRIRDLLINKHGVGNIITFSALSNQPPPTISSPKQDTSTAETDQQINKTKQAETIPETSTSSSTTTKNNNNTQSNIQSTNDKPTLVMRRIGNRDYFTRVKVAQPEDKISELEKGVFKPKPVDDTITGNVSKGIKNDEEEDDDDNEEEGDEVNGEKVELEEEEKYDFDTTLDQLAQLRDSIEQKSSMDESMIATESELLRLLNILVKHFSDELSIEEWDLVVSSVYKWTSYISNSDQSLIDNIENVNFSINVLNFIYQLIELAKSWRIKKDSKEEFPMMQSLLDDWDNFYSSDIYQDLVFLYFKIASINNLKHEQVLLLESLSNIVLDVDPKLVLSKQNLSEYLSTTKIELEPQFELPKNIRYCNIDENKFQGFAPICSLLKSNYRAVIVCAHSMLSKNIDTICLNAQASLVITEQEDLDNISFVPPAALMSILASRDSIMSALLSDYQVGDISVAIDPKSDSYTCTLTYLLVWDLVIQFIVGFYKEMGHRMIYSLKRLGLIQRLLDNVFMLLPPLGERDSLNFRIEAGNNSDKNTTPGQSWNLSSFLKSSLRTTIQRPVNEIELMALHIYFSVAFHMPVTVRKWYNNNSNKRLCNLVNEYTVKHISRVICSSEMEAVQEKCQQSANEDKMDNLVIKTRSNAAEVYVVYTRDEFRAELTIKLPINYPLGSIQIDCGKRVGVTELEWRTWLLQLTKSLSHQNGPILDGIKMWRKNIDKRFEGVEECMICFSILLSNNQLPKKKCQACTKMFHNLCLYKWFKSSGNSTCPLCRNTW